MTEIKKKYLYFKLLNKLNKELLVIFHNDDSIILIICNMIYF